mmetsp:Transcript_5497/g.20762  ORF Transcript_5497/g.20762 Transcript_5497/m.20762 type:complete len:632 (-) Transcript_5497:1071-2966(-)
MAFSLTSVVNEEFKMMGLSLRGDAMTAVVGFLERAVDANSSLSKMLDALDARALTTSIVDKAIVDEVVRGLDKQDRITVGGFNADGNDRNNASQGGHGHAQMDDDDGITIVDAFKTPKFTYDTQRRVFHEITGKGKTASGSINANANSKIELYRERFLLLQQRIQRHRMFLKPAFNCGASSRVHCELTPLTGLLGASGETKFVMGCLSQLEDDRFFLEDLTGQIQIDVSHAATSSGLFTENCIVVAEGEVRKDGVFEARALGFPPGEAREESANASAHCDFFGAGRLRPADVKRLVESEAVSTSDMFVLVSDVWLDKPTTLSRLKMIFEGFDGSDAIPTMFVLMGDFCSTPLNTGNTQQGANFETYKQGFDRLASLLEHFPRLRQESRWVFVPGPGDPGITAALPRPGLRKSLVGRLPAVLPRVTFASNPCRVRYKSQDLVFIREDLQSRMRRACVLPPTLLELEKKLPPTTPPTNPAKKARVGHDDTEGDAIDEATRMFDDAVDATGGGGSPTTANNSDSDVSPSKDENEHKEESEWEQRPLFKHLAATLVQQAHLTPLPIQQTPVYWDYDHALRLYPAPHCVILGDRTEQQALAKFEDTAFANPGCFADDGSFAVYFPATRAVEFSAAS